jgi:putative CocE/NonD family hydrolase
LALAILSSQLPTDASAGSTPSTSSYGIELKEVWIPMPDGVRLAADLYLPTGAEPGEKFPVLLEYLPYRKNESRSSCHALFSYFVRRGYAVARVDIRGTGASEGVLVAHEYTEQEQLDGEEVIAWLAAQPFSTGSVGMFGISWGGFNSIHMAMRRPPALKAIIAVEATDDLFEDDVHYMDGGMHLDSYEMIMDVANIVPAAPDYEIDAAYFENRFDVEPWLLLYKRQQRDGPFWNRASLNSNYESIEIPTFVIGGWYDGYRDSVPRMLEHLKAPVKGMMGPWNHTYPNWAAPPPAMEWRHEAVRWFDHWLKGLDTGIMDEPRFAVYVRDWHPPGAPPEFIPGAWRWEEGWPIERIAPRELSLQPDHRLAEGTPPERAHRLRYTPTVGREAGGSVQWWGDWTPDQRPTDAFSLVYETEPLAEEIEILGFPHARLNVSADAPQAHWFARLSDVAPDGRVTLVAGAGFNGAHRDSAEQPKPLVPDRVYPLDIEMHFTSWRFPKGHRIRLAVNNSQWPMIWPTPHPMTTTLHLGGGDPSRLILPVVPEAERPTPEFLAPEESPTLPGYETLETGTLSGYPEVTTIVRDARRESVRVNQVDSGASAYPWGEVRFEHNIAHEASDRDPANASVRSTYTTTAVLENRTLRWEGTLEFRSDAEAFFYTFNRKLFRDDELLREKTWQETIPRDHQ